MKLQIKRNILADAVNIVSKAIPVRTTVNILKCFLLDASEEDILIIGNNMDLGIETHLEGLILEHGVIAINADVFSNIVRKLPEGLVNITVEGDRITIQCEQALFHIQGMSGSEFPYLPDVKRNYGIEITEFTLRNVITKTIFSISSNESNILMTGELFEVRNNTLRVVSLDGHRISIRKEELKNSYDDIRVIIPGKTLLEISRILGGSMEEMVHIYFTQRHALFEFGQTVVVTRLIEGMYFDVDGMLSSDYSIQVTVNCQEMLSSLERSVLLLKEEDKKPIILDIRDDEMEMRINTAQGSFRENIPVEKKGNDLVIGFNPKFLIEALRAIDDETVNIYLKTARSPAFLQDENTFCYLVLPINIIND